MRRNTVIFLLLSVSLLLRVLLPSADSSELSLKPYKASPDQVLVVYNADWPHRSEGTAAIDDSREIAEYYVRKHTLDGKKPYLLGLTCKHVLRRHLNEWFIKEDSNDNANGILFRGKGKSPADTDWIRDSRKVELQLDSGDIDWGSIRIVCRSETTGQEVLLTPLRVALQISGLPKVMKEGASYPPVEPGKGRCYRFDASRLFAGTVTIRLTARNLQGKEVRDISATYYDVRDFIFSPTGADGVPDDAILEEDVLQPVRAFLEDPAHAAPDGTLLKDHILYIVAVHGMPYSAKAVFGIAHGATANKADYGSLASLEQRLQTLYYPWQSVQPPVVSMYMAAGPDSEKGVVNHIITTAMHRPQTGIRWNPYMHPDTYSFLRSNAPAPKFLPLLPLSEQRKTPEATLFAYGVTRIDATTTEEAKRIIDYTLYANRYLCPEMDCRVTTEIKKQKSKKPSNMVERLRQSENAWGSEELGILGFGKPGDFDAQGLPFLARHVSDNPERCGEKRDWKLAGFYPGGIARTVVSSNGLNYKEADIWNYISKGVSVSAAGAPAYAGGPHITNASFWDNRILLKYLLRGRDLGEAFLRSTYYVNWSTSLIGDPLFHPDLRETVPDKVPPRPAGAPSLAFTAGTSTAEAHLEVGLYDDRDTPEVALLHVTARDAEGNEVVAVSPLYSSHPRLTIRQLKPGVSYSFSAELVDPYGNRSALPPVTGKSTASDAGLSLLNRFLKGKDAP